MTAASVSGLLTAIRSKASGPGRVLVAIAGAPGSGKSTFAAQLARDLGPAATVLPMDGFHHDNRTLAALGLMPRKGAPETFDALGFAALVRQVKAGGTIAVPGFDRAADCVVPGQIRIDASQKIILVEGNYLLLDQPDWRETQPLWDVTVSLDVPEAELEKRLVARWLDHGLSPLDARARAQGNDLANARTIAAHSVPAQFVISPELATEYHVDPQNSECRSEM